MISNANEALDKNPKDRVLKAKIGANIAFIYLLLGIGDRDTESYFQSGVNNEDIAKIEALILKRTEAKKAKDFQAADLIRNELLNMGISLMDTPNKTIWEKI
jgi:cysteinyl-tRNA synthetase